MEAFPDVVQRAIEQNPPPPSFETGAIQEIYNYLHMLIK